MSFAFTTHAASKLHAASKIPCAIIVTHNRAELLARAVAAVLAQTYACAFLVVDNKSTDHTAAVLSEIVASNPGRGEVLLLPQNLGGAGGFHAGLCAAYAKGHADFWLMDDDCIAAPDALAQLLAGRAGASTATGREPGFACSNVRWRDGTACWMNLPTPDRAWLDASQNGAPWLNIASATFVSLLLSRTVLERHGLPFKEYFIWFDDTDFTRRIARHQPGVLCLASLVQHEIARNEPFSIRHADATNVWKYAYGLRNEASHIGATHGFAACLAFVLKTAGIVLSAPLAWPVRVKLWRALLRGLVFRPKITFPQPAAETNPID